MDFLEIENQIKDLKIPESKILYQEPMRKYTTFKIGGPAECLIKIDNLEELKKILEIVSMSTRLAIMTNKRSATPTTLTVMSSAIINVLFANSYTHSVLLASHII